MSVANVGANGFLDSDHVPHLVAATHPPKQTHTHTHTHNTHTHTHTHTNPFPLCFSSVWIDINAALPVPSLAAVAWFILHRISPAA